MSCAEIRSVLDKDDSRREVLQRLGRAHLLETDDTLRRMADGVKRLALRDLTLWSVKR